MLLMPSNNSNAHKLAGMYPNRIGQLMGPGGWRDPRDLPFAIDNGCFAVWSKGKDWDSDAYLKFLDTATPHNPRWAIVPDVVGDAVATFDRWFAWHQLIRDRGLSLALAVQDGMTPDSVEQVLEGCEPDVIFVGGTTNWKRQTMWHWCRRFPRVHVGRINTERWLWTAHRCGAESVDGTGYFRGDQQQLAGMHRYLRRSTGDMTTRQLYLAGFDFARESYL